MLCAFALVVGTPVTAWWLYARTNDAPPPVQTVSRTIAPVVPVARPAPARPRPDIAWFDPTLTAGYAPRSFAARAAPDPDPVPRPAEAVPSSPDPAPEIALSDVPTPVPRPLVPRPPIPRPDGRAPHRLADLAPTAAPADRPGFFDRMFGGSRPAGPALAYAAPDDGGFADTPGRRAASADSRTAIYDIAAHTVTLPSGTRLEAHSGLGASYDNPRSVTEHMRGATPPAVYDLTPREGLFHGVRALRLSPSDPAATYGRMGLLAHSYMLGPRGESNGCVVFRDYAAFLRAYESGEVRRLVVVSGTT